MPRAFSLPARFQAIGWGDFDGDGDPDFLFTTSTGSLSVAFNQGNLQFGTPVSSGSLNRLFTNSIRVGDLDGDQDVDLLIGGSPNSPGGQRLRIMMNDGTGNFTDVTATHWPASVVPGLLRSHGELIDHDEDGDLDVIVATSLSQPGGNRLMLNDGSGVFTEAPVESFFTRVRALGPWFDFDGDGDLDMAAGPFLWGTERHVRFSSLARVGRTWEIEMHTNTAGVRVAQWWIGFSLIPPFELAGIGRLHLVPNAQLLGPALAMQPGTTMARVGVPLPSDPALLGVRLFVQGAVANLTAGTIGLTNLARDEVVR